MVDLVKSVNYQEINFSNPKDVEKKFFALQEFFRGVNDNASKFLNKFRMMYASGVKSTEKLAKELLDIERKRNEHIKDLVKIFGKIQEDLVIEQMHGLNPEKEKPQEIKLKSEKVEKARVEADKKLGLFNPLWLWIAAQLIGALLNTMWGKVAAVFAKLAALRHWLKYHWLGRLVAKVFRGVKWLFSNTVGRVFKWVGKGLWAGVAKIGNTVKNVLGMGWAKIKQLGNLVKTGIISAFKPVGDFFKNSKVGQVASKAFEAIKTGAGSAIAKIKAMAGPVARKLKNGVEFVGGGIKAAWNKFKNFVPNIWDKFKKAAKFLKLDGMINFLGAAAKKIVGAVLGPIGWALICYDVYRGMKDGKTAPGRVINILDNISGNLVIEKLAGKLGTYDKNKHGSVGDWIWGKVQNLLQGSKESMGVIDTEDTMIQSIETMGALKDPEFEEIVNNISNFKDVGNNQAIKNLIQELHKNHPEVQKKVMKQFTEDLRKVSNGEMTREEMLKNIENTSREEFAKIEKLREENPELQKKDEVPTDVEVKKESTPEPVNEVKEKIEEHTEVINNLAEATLHNTASIQQNAGTTVVVNAPAQPQHNYQRYVFE